VRGAARPLAESKHGLAIDLGLRDYEESLALQRRLVARRQAGALPDLLLLVEHPDVITVGRRQGARDHARSAGVPVVEIERGGDVTYHGPGQLVAYPIIALDEAERDLHRYLRALEEALLGVLDELGLHGRRNPGYTGAWIGERKVASIGVAVRRWVTLHGLALNVCTALERFFAIQPCGLPAAVMTSLERELGRAITVDEVKPSLRRHLGRELGRAFDVAAPADVGEIG
jgi:lipoate-protein ligase B